MRERDIEAYLHRRVLALGGEFRRTEWIGRANAPDDRIMLPNRKPFWVECKATGEKPTPAQTREHNRMRRLGEIVEVVDSYEAVDALLG